MTLMLKAVEREDVVPLHLLTVRKDQEKFVAPNAVTLAQAQFETGSNVWVIWDEDVRVGLLAAIDLRRQNSVETEKHPQAIYLWRLSIGADFQSMGFGREAMNWLLEWAKTNGHPEAMTSCVPENGAALKFYRSLGFQPTGEFIDGEVVLAMPL